MQPAPFIVGVPRSGTTLLRLMLDSHPDLTIPPETHFIPAVAQAAQTTADPAQAFVDRLTTSVRWPDFGLDPQALARRVAEVQPFDLGEAFRAFYRLYAAKVGKPHWGDKTPGYLLHLRLIHDLLPEARFVHLIRDGRDVALSIRGLPPPVGGPELARAAGSVEAAARLWVARIRAARRQASALPYYLEVRYEDLVLHAEATLRRICQFINLPWSPTMLDYYQLAEDRMREIERGFAHGDGAVFPASHRRAQHLLTRQPPQASRAHRWRTDMTIEDCRKFERIARRTLRELGYETAKSWPEQLWGKVRFSRGRA